MRTVSKRSEPNPNSVEAVIAPHRRSFFSLRSPTFWMSLIAIGAIAAWYSSIDRDAAPTRYVTDSAFQGELRVTVTATGTLQPTTEIEVGSEVSGILEEVFVDFNDPVAAGQIIAQLDTEQLEARVVSARASLAMAEAALQQAQATEEEATTRAARSEALFGQNALSQQELDTDVAAARRAIAAVASAGAQLSSARATLQEAETALRKAVIRSPIDGIVLAREVDTGQTLAASFESPVLFRLARDLKEMVLHLDVDESDIGQVREGQQARFRVDAFPGRSFDAEIVSVRFDPRTVNNVVTYETILAVQNPDLLLRPGMTATADILVAGIDDALLVPNRALRFVPPDQALERTAANAGWSGGSSAASGRVWVLRDGVPAAVPVEVGLSNDEFTQILDGHLDIGTEIIIDTQRPERGQESGGFFG
jgi:HlyD family secretion protein